MRTITCSLIVSAFIGIPAWGQGSLVFVYDQQTSTNETPLSFGSGSLLPDGPGNGQSFTPSLAAVGFIRLNLADGNPNDGLGTSLLLNLRGDSMTGTVLGASEQIALTNRFAGIVTFFLNTPVSVTPATPYFFELVHQSGGPLGVAYAEFGYQGGSAFGQGAPNLASDLWFREGIVVPEPRTWVLLLLGIGALAWRKQSPP